MWFRTTWNMITPLWVCSSDLTSAQEQDRSPTAYLDGLRGLAAFVVFLSHGAEPWYGNARRGYEPGDMETILQLPVIRLLFHGSPMVVIFFVISGFALSIKFLSRVRAEKWSQCTSMLGSATLRRGIRLYLPAVFSTMIVAVLTHFKMYDFPYEYTIPGRHTPQPEYRAGFRHQFTDWFRYVMEDMTNSWACLEPKPIYNPPLWTISIEYRLSLRLYLVLLATSHMRSVSRMWSIVGLCTYNMYLDRSFDTAFLMGAGLAELHLIRQATRDGMKSHLAAFRISEGLAPLCIFIGRRDSVFSQLQLLNTNLPTLSTAAGFVHHNGSFNNFGDGDNNNLNFKNHNWRTKLSIVAHRLSLSRYSDLFSHRFPTFEYGGGSGFDGGGDGGSDGREDEGGSPAQPSPCPCPD
ncbi:hypothetical protein KCU67_g1498, partial [Aureobasidium melanogenum]